MTKRRRIRLPLVRRSSHIKAMKYAAAAHTVEVEALKAELQQVQRQLFEETHSLQADRDRLHTRAERLQVELDQLVLHTEKLSTRAERLQVDLDQQVSQSETLNARAHERDHYFQRAADFEAEATRLGASENKLTQHLGELQNENSALAQRAEDYKAECLRLGADAIDIAKKNASLKATQAELIRELYMSSARDPYFIGTFPRSGTWMLKYFLNFLDRYSRAAGSPDIKEIYDQVTADSHYLLKFGKADPPAQRVSVSHWMCPGVFSLSPETIADFLRLLEQLGCADYQRETNDKHAVFHPEREQGRILFVFRNPFDVYRSYADIYERRVTMEGRHPYPFNPMTPFATELMNSDSEVPFDHFIDGFQKSGFTEYFIAYFMSFLLMQDAYPDKVRILRYEDAMADRAGYLREVASFGKIGSDSDPHFKEALAKAVDATDIRQMKAYEAQLGHALSGATTYYGEANPTHLSVKKKNWRELFKPADRDFLSERIGEFEPRILNYLPELFETNLS